MRGLLSVPGLMRIALVVGGATSDSDLMIWIGVGLAAVTLIVFLVLKAGDWAAEAAERRRIWTSG